MNNLNRVYKFSLFVLIYNVLVILFGAFVRASGSGSGCGAHWPSCNGEVIPTAPIIETIIEFTHRVTSGFSLIFVFFLFILIFRSVEKGNKLRIAVLSSLFFTILEALLGAGLVLFELVGDNDTILRAVVISIHLLNTFMLLGSLVLISEWSMYGVPKKIVLSRLKGIGTILMTLFILVLSMSGAITALGDTLFPAQSIAEGFQQDFAASSHFLIELRIYHPIIAVATVLIILGFLKMFNNSASSVRQQKYGKIVMGLFLCQLFLGGLNVLLLAPIWMQIIHLLFADLIWISYIVFVNQFVSIDD